jgi:hypothetical protein
MVASAELSPDGSNPRAGAAVAMDELGRLGEALRTPSRRSRRSSSRVAFADSATAARFP